MNIDDLAAEVKQLSALVVALTEAGPPQYDDGYAANLALTNDVAAIKQEIVAMRAKPVLTKADIEAIAKRIAGQVSVANIRGAAEGLVEGVTDIEATINKRIDATAASLATEATRLREIAGSSAADAVAILRDGAYNFAHGE